MDKRKTTSEPPESSISGDDYEVFEAEGDATIAELESLPPEDFEDEKSALHPPVAHRDDPEKRSPASLLPRPIRTLVKALPANWQLPATVAVMLVGAAVVAALAYSEHRSMLRALIDAARALGLVEVPITGAAE